MALPSLPEPFLARGSLAILVTVAVAGPVAIALTSRMVASGRMVAIALAAVFLGLACWCGFLSFRKPLRHADAIATFAFDIETDGPHVLWIQLGSSYRASSAVELYFDAPRERQGIQWTLDTLQQAAFDLDGVGPVMLNADSIDNESGETLLFQGVDFGSAKILRYVVSPATSPLLRVSRVRVRLDKKGLMELGRRRASERITALLSLVWSGMAIIVAYRKSNDRPSLVGARAP